jgi:hypothetical protein
VGPLRAITVGVSEAEAAGAPRDGATPALRAAWSKASRTTRHGLAARRSGRSRSAVAGAAAATVWALQEPLDQKLLRCDYSDVAILGKAVTRGPSWRIAGLVLHAANGAIFGLVFHELRRRLRLDSRRLALGIALGEHVSL